MAPTNLLPSPSKTLDNGQCKIIKQLKNNDFYSDLVKHCHY